MLSPTPSLRSRRRGVSAWLTTVRICPLVALTALMLPCVALPVTAADPTPPPPKEAPRPVVWNNLNGAPAPGLQHGSFNSAAIGTEVGYNVWLPPGYEEGSTRYPVVYFLHGAGGNENSDAAAFAGLVAHHVQRQKIPPVICVFPNGGPRSGYRDHAERGRVETMIIRELVPLIDERYRTQPEARSRVVVGFSMGGAGAVRFALTYPELFSAAGSWGGAFGGRNNDALPEDYGVEALSRLAKGQRFLLSVGTEDFVLGSYPAMLENLVRAKAPFEFELLPDVKHDPGAYYRQSGERMLRFLTVGFASSAQP